MPAYRFVNRDDLITTATLEDCMDSVGRQTHSVGPDGKIVVLATEPAPAAGLRCTAGLGKVFNVFKEFARWAIGIDDGSLPGPVQDHSPRRYAQAIWANIPD